LNLKTEVERFAIGMRSAVTLLTGLMVGLLFLCFMIIFIGSMHGTARAVADNKAAMSQAGI
jgi:hypothetical protein